MTERLSLATRERLAYEAFQQTATYDAIVSAYLSGALDATKGLRLALQSCAGGISLVAGGSPSSNTSNADITDDFSI